MGVVVSTERRKVGKAAGGREGHFTLSAAENRGQKNVLSRIKLYFSFDTPYIVLPALNAALTNQHTVRPLPANMNI